MVKGREYEYGVDPEISKRTNKGTTRVKGTTRDWFRMQDADLLDLNCEVYFKGCQVWGKQNNLVSFIPILGVGGKIKG